MSEQFDHLTDEDLAAVENIIEGADRRKMGEHILHMWQEGLERQQQQNRSLLDAIARAHQAQEGEQE